MKLKNIPYSRRDFIKKGALFLPALFLPSFGDNPIIMEFFNRDGSELVYVPRSGLHAASVIKSRTFSSVQDNRIQLSNSTFARLWASALGTSWTTIRVACRISMTDTGANVTSTPRFYFGISSGTSALPLDASVTHWLGVVTNQTQWRRVSAGPPAYYDLSNNSGNGWPLSKYISTTLTGGTDFCGGGYNTFLFDSTTANRAALFFEITKGSPNFSCKLLFNGAPAGTQSSGDIDLAAYVGQLTLSTPALTNHVLRGPNTLAIDEGTNGSFTAIHAACDRTSPNIEISDLAVVKLA